MDRQDITLISLWVHVPFIIAWIGLVMMDVVAMTAPGLERGQRVRMLLWSRGFVILSIIVIMATGIWQTMENPFFKVDSWDTLQELKKRTYGEALFYKHVFVVMTFGLTILVRFILAPRLRDGDDISGGVAVTSDGVMAMLPAGESLLNLTRLATFANLVACLLAILLATRMIYELH